MSIVTLTNILTAILQLFLHFCECKSISIWLHVSASSYKLVLILPASFMSARLLTAALFSIVIIVQISTAKLFVLFVFFLLPLPLALILCFCFSWSSSSSSASSCYYQFSYSYHAYDILVVAIATLHVSFVLLLYWLLQSLPCFLLLFLTCCYLIIDILAFLLLPVLFLPSLLLSARSLIVMTLMLVPS